ncbi:hypothetical protein ACLOJK_003285 [Asimina triloba]
MPGVTDAGMVALGSGPPSLQVLDVTNRRKLTDKGLVAVAKGCCNLKSLHLAGCRLVTDGLLEVLSKHCPHLEELGLALDISCCPEITDVAFSGLERGESEACLRVLKACNCPKITVLGIGLLLKFCKSLHNLDVSSCPNITKTVCEQAGQSKKCGSSEVFDLNCE